MKQSVTITTTKEKLEEMRNYYADFIVDNKGEYIFFQADKNHIIITAYDSKKANKKVTFNGENALLEAQIWDPNITIKETKEKVKEDRKSVV